MLRPRASGPASGLYYRGAYAALDFASRIYELDDVSYTSGGLTTVPGFTFTGASLRTMFDSTGAMTYGPNNLCTYSQEFDNAAWTKQGGFTTVTANATTAPDGTATGDLFTEDSLSNIKSCYQGIVVIAGAYTWSVFFKAGSGSTRYLRLSISSSASDFGYITVNMSTGAITQVAAVTGTATAPSGDVTSVGGGWYRARLTVTLAAAGASCFFIPFDTGTPAVGTDHGREAYTGNGSTWSLWGAQLEAVTYRTTPAAYMPTTSAAYYGPRLVYDPVTLASLGILVEEARTNLCLYSQQFDNAAWTKQADATTVTANATTSPDGTADADLFTENMAYGAKSCYQGNASAAGTYTLSVYFKAGSGSTRYLRLTLTSGASDFGYMTVNMSTGAITQAAAVIGTATAASGDVTSVGGGWYRARLTTTLAASTGPCFFIPLDSGTPVVVAGDYGRDSYTGNGSTWSLYQAQLEAGTGASSPIPTTTAAVTRAADDATLTVSIAAGTMVSEAYGSINAGLTKVAAHVSLSNVDDSTAWVIFGQTNMAGAMTSYRRAAGASVNTGTGSTFAAGARTKMAMRFGSPSGDAVSVNGATPIAIAAAAAPLVVTQLRIGCWSSDPGYLNNAVARVRLYYPLLPDGNLQSLATL